MSEDVPASSWLERIWKRLTGGIAIFGKDGLTIASPANPVPVDATFTGTLEVNLDHADDDVLVYGNDGTTDRKIKTDAAGELQVDVLTLPAVALDAATGSGNVSALTLRVVLAADVVPKVADADLTVTIPDAVTVGAADSIIVAAGTTGERDIVISVPTTADTGIRINVGAAATSVKFLIEAGGVAKLNTNQAVHALRAGAADVTAYVMTGVPA